MKLDHILLTTDLSDESLRPCSPVAELARGAGARVTLLHAVQELSVPPQGAPLAPPVTYPDLPAQVEAARGALVREREALPAELDVRTEVITAERVAEGIADWAHEHEADLIVLSTHGRTGFRHFVLGSVAERLLRCSRVPVLVFPMEHAR